MSGYREDVSRIQRLIGNAFSATGTLAALVNDGQTAKRQKTLEQVVGSFEVATVELRRLCERYMGVPGNYAGKSVLPFREITGSVELIEYHWLRIQLNTLLPSAAYQTPLWLGDTIRRLLDDYERAGRSLPYYNNALMVIEEQSNIAGRRVFDQDNKGWKAISNSIKGRLIPDDDQYTLGMALLSTRSDENTCSITLLESSDAADFFSLRAGDYSF